MRILGFSSFFSIICSGWVIDISIFSANCNNVDSVKVLKNGRFSKIFLFDYLRKEVLIEGGKLEMKAASYSILKFFFILAHSSM